MGTLTSVYVVSLPKGVTEVKSVSATISSHDVQDVSTVEEQIRAIDLSALSSRDQDQIRALLQDYQCVLYS